MSGPSSRCRAATLEVDTSVPLDEVVETILSLVQP